MGIENSSHPDGAERRVERVLDQSLERIETPEAAHAIVARVAGGLQKVAEQSVAPSPAAEPSSPRLNRS